MINFEEVDFPIDLYLILTPLLTLLLILSLFNLKFCVQQADQLQAFRQKIEKVKEMRKRGGVELRKEEDSVEYENKCCNNRYLRILGNLARQFCIVGLFRYEYLSRDICLSKISVIMVISFIIPSFNFSFLVSIASFGFPIFWRLYEANKESNEIINAPQVPEIEIQCINLPKEQKKKYFYFRSLKVSIPLNLFSIASIFSLIVFSYKYYVNSHILAFLTISLINIGLSVLIEVPLLALFTLVAMNFISEDLFILSSLLFYTNTKQTEEFTQKLNLVFQKMTASPYIQNNTKQKKSIGIDATAGCEQNTINTLINQHDKQVSHKNEQIMAHISITITPNIVQEQTNSKQMIDPIDIVINIDSNQNCHEFEIKQEKVSLEQEQEPYLSTIQVIEDSKSRRTQLTEIIRHPSHSSIKPEQPNFSDETHLTRPFYKQKKLNYGTVEKYTHNDQSVYENNWKQYEQIRQALHHRIQCSENEKTLVIEKYEREEGSEKKIRLRGRRRENKENEKGDFDRRTYKQVKRDVENMKLQDNHNYSRRLGRHI